MLASLRRCAMPWSCVLSSTSKPRSSTVLCSRQSVTSPSLHAVWPDFSPRYIFVSCLLYLFTMLLTFQGSFATSVIYLLLPSSRTLSLLPLHCIPGERLSLTSSLASLSCPFAVSRTSLGIFPLSLWALVYFAVSLHPNPSRIPSYLLLLFPSLSPTTLCPSPSSFSLFTPSAATLP